MSVEILERNMLDASDDVIILTVDGAAKGMEGNIARAFARKYPEVWEDIEYDINYPIPLGGAQLLQLPSDLECQNKMVVMASTLNHINVLTDNDKLKVVEAALRKSLSIAMHNGASSVGTVVLTGGWRLEVLQAFEAMIEVYERAQENNPHIPILRIYTLNNLDFGNIVNFLEQNKRLVKTLEYGYLIG